MSNKELAGKKVVVTGAAGGIGAAIMKRLLRERAIPIGVDLKPYVDSELHGDLKPTVFQHGRDFEYYEVDASNQELMTNVLEKFDNIYAAILNAGLLGTDTSHGGRSLASLQKMLTAHLLTAFTTTEVVYPKMVDGGRLLAIGSVETTTPDFDVVLYAIAKAAVEGMAIAYAEELKLKGITFNIIVPGDVSTKTEHRSVTPEEVAVLAMLYLAPNMQVVTAQRIVMNGGPVQKRR